MRHFLSPYAVQPLAHRVHPPTSTALLVSLPTHPLPSSSRPPCARPIAAPSSRHIARRAQRHRPATPRVSTEDDVQRDHGPRRREARHPRGPVRPRMGRTATSRSAGAIEGAEVQAPRPRYVRRALTVADASVGHPFRQRRGVRGHRRDALHRDRRISPSRSLVLFAAIRGDHLRRDQQLFSRFARTRASRRGQTPGLGLGLYISSGLIEAQGGRMWVESTLGQRTSFHFTLPGAPPGKP
jgi:hypothetical protein